MHTSLRKDNISDIKSNLWHSPNVKLKTREPRVLIYLIALKKRFSIAYNFQQQ